jgi:hypothetical protein
MYIEKGWAFDTADFSLVASGNGPHGYVRLVRDVQNKAKWFAQSPAIKDCPNAPELYVGAGAPTLEEAINIANQKAKTAQPIHESNCKCERCS